MEARRSGFADGSAPPSSSACTTRALPMCAAHTSAGVCSSPRFVARLGGQPASRRQRTRWPRSSSSQTCNTSRFCASVSNESCATVRFESVERRSAHNASSARQPAKVLKGGRAMDTSTACNQKSVEAAARRLSGYADGGQVEGGARGAEGRAAGGEGEARGGKGGFPDGAAGACDSRIRGAKHAIPCVRPTRPCRPPATRTHCVIKRTAPSYKRYPRKHMPHARLAVSAAARPPPPSPPPPPPHCAGRA